MATGIVTPRGRYTFAELAQLLGCVPEALYRYLERRGSVWHLKPPDEAHLAQWHERFYEPERRRRDGVRLHRGIPVYDEGGNFFAHSIAAAARLLGCTPNNLHGNDYLDLDYRDGVRLRRRPFRRDRFLTRAVLGPGGRRWPNVYEAAQELRVLPRTIEVISRRDGDRTYILPRIPQPRRREVS
jgi:hypothetical protein